MLSRGASVLWLLLVGCAPPVPRPDAATELDGGEPVPSCLVLPALLDFGELPVGTPRTLSFSFFNASGREQELQFSELRDPFSANLSGPVRLRRSEQLVAFFSFEPPDGRLHLQELTFVGGTGCAPQLVTLQGLGRGGLQVPQSLELPPTDPGTSVTVMARLVNSSRAPMRVQLLIQDRGLSSDAGSEFDGGFDPRSGPSFFEPLDTSLTIPATSGVDVPVTFHARRVGRLFDLLVATPMNQPAIPIQLRGQSGVPRLVFQPPSVDVEHLPPGGVVRLLNGHNAGEGELELGSVELVPQPGTAPGEGSVSTVTTFEPQVALRLTSNGVGQRSWLLRVTVPGGRPPVVEVPVSVRAEFHEPCSERVTVAPMRVVLAPGASPSVVPLTLSNATGRDCLVDTFEFDRWTEWSLDADEFIVPAGGSVQRQVSITGPGSAVVRFRTYGQNSSAVQVVAPEP